MKKLTHIGLCNCFAVRQAARHLTRLYESGLADAKLTSAQFSILVALDEAGEMTMAELADAMVMDRTTLVRTIKPLQEEQLVIKRASAENSRRLAFSLSIAGQQRLEKGFELWTQIQQKFEAKLGADKAERLRNDLLALPQLN
jgi:DNA-binding MarR family transcriptional regulator